MPEFDEGNPAASAYAIPNWFFGVKVVEELMWDASYGWFRGLRITYVYWGSPASYRVEPGDVITRVDGARVETFAELHNAIGFSATGIVWLRVRDVRTGGFVDLHNIQLAPYQPGPGPGPGPGPNPGP